MLEEIQELVLDITTSVAANLSTQTFDIASANLYLELGNF